jgi:hypothetical protein
MADPYTLLGLTPSASSSEVKQAYHQKLREFPAHSHPREFQNIRAAYDAIRAAGDHQGDPLQPGPMLAQIDPAAVEALAEQLRSSSRLSLDELLRLTF